MRRSAPRRVGEDERALSGNQLTGLPDAISQLTGLQILYLYSNQLSGLPESIVALTNLTTLCLLYSRRRIRTAQSVAGQAWLQACENSRVTTYMYTSLLVVALASRMGGQ